MKRPHPGFWWLGLLVLVGLLLAFSPFPVADYLVQFALWVQDLGSWGVGLFILCYILACVLLVPGSLLTVAAGYIYGLWGIAVVSAGSTLGAAAAFLIGRTLARRRIETVLANQPRFLALDQAVAEQGFQIVLLTRLSPVFPFTLLNYFFGLTRVRFWTYVLASWLGMLPGTVLYVYLGTTIQQLADIAQGGVARDSVPQRIFFAVGLLATLIVTVLLTRLARHTLSRTAPATLAPPASQHSQQEPH
jgi:uncharacterized membrane protein YdjX (TVP38/TMEM64 family)